MITFNRYPHVKDLILYYALSLNNTSIPTLIKTWVKSKEEAYILSKFIWKMVDQMAIDYKSKKEVLGQIDNTHLLVDVNYEIELYLSELWYWDIWDEVSERA